MTDDSKQLEEEVRKVNYKIDGTDEKIEDVNRRMDERLLKLENEMKKSERIRKKSNELREKEKSIGSLDTQGRSDSVKNVNENVNVEGKMVEIFLQEPQEMFRSSWAQGIQQELSKAAEEADKLKNRRNEDPLVRKTMAARKVLVEDTPVYTREEEVPLEWEERLVDGLFYKRKDKVKVRKPVASSNWFGMDTSSDDSETELNEWKMIGRRATAEEKKIAGKRRKEERKRDCASRAARMISMGPISGETINYFRKDGTGFEDAKKEAVKEFLQYNLDYDVEELRSLRIEETRLSTKGDDIMNVALASEDDVHEIYVRQSECRNEKIVVRCYIPPNFYKRFMALNEVCAKKRTDNDDLKTQLRFSNKDVEIFIKYKSEEMGYRKVNISEFTDSNLIPEFDNLVKWKRFTEKPPRRITNTHGRSREMPSMVGQTNCGRKVQHVSQSEVRRGEDTTLRNSTNTKPDNRNAETQPTLTRINSNTITSEPKKIKYYDADSSRSKETESGSDNDGSSMETHSE